MKPGKYYGRFVGAATEENGNGKEYLKLSWLVTHELGNGAWVELPQPVQAQTRLWLTEGVWNNPQAVEILGRNLSALGFNGDYGAPQFDPSLAEGIELFCENEVGKDNKVREKWEPAIWSGGDGKPVDSQTAKKFNALWRSKIGTPKPATQPTPPPASKPAAPAEPAPPAATGETTPTGTAIPF